MLNCLTTNTCLLSKILLLKTIQQNNLILWHLVTTWMPRAPILPYLIKFGLEPEPARIECSVAWPPRLYGQLSPFCAYCHNCSAALSVCTQWRLWCNGSPYQRWWTEDRACALAPWKWRPRYGSDVRRLRNRGFITCGPGRHALFEDSAWKRGYYPSSPSVSSLQHCRQVS